MSENVYDILVERGFIEQATHEDEIRELLGKESVTFYIGFDATADSLTAGETNPYNKARKIFDYICKTYPWASAREYSTLENIPSYVLANNHGDCGQVGLTFITTSSSY